MALHTFNNDLERSVDILSTKNKRCINGLKIEKDDNLTSFLNMKLSNNYIPHITLPTCVTGHSISLIDHIFIKESDKICYKITAGNIYNNINDHISNFVVSQNAR